MLMRFSLTRFGRTRLLVAGASIALVGAAAAVAGVFAAGTPVRVPDNPLGASSGSMLRTWSPGRRRQEA